MIKLVDAYKTYDNGTKALNGVNLEIADGEFAFIVGPSGSGKSTMMKLLIGEIRPTSGKVYVNDFDLTTIKNRQLPYMRRTVGVVFQDFRLIDKKTVFENVAFVMRAVGTPPRIIKKRVPYVLDLVGVLHKARRQKRGRKDRMGKAVPGNHRHTERISVGTPVDRHFPLGDSRENL